MKPTPIITVIRPELTAEEREKRMKRIEEAVRSFWIAKERRERNASSDNL